MADTLPASDSAAYIADPAAVAGDVQVAREEIEHLLRHCTNRAQHMRLTRALLHIDSALARLA